MKPSGEDICIRAATVIFERFEFPDEVGPAKLTFAVFMISAVSGVIVTGDYPVKLCPENFTQHLGASGGRNDEVHTNGGNEGPKVSTPPLVFPAGLIDVEVKRIDDELFDMLNNRLAGLRDASGNITGRGKGDIQIVQIFHDFGNAPS